MDISNVNIDYVSLLTAFIFSNILFLLIIKNYKQSRKNVINIQDTHDAREVPRLGGVVIFAIFFVYEILFFEYIEIWTWLSLLIILIPAFLEDVNINISPYLRLLSILLGSLFVVINLPTLPQFNFGYLDNIFNNHIFQLIFFPIAMAAMINGQNMIDGTNGLSGFSSIIIFITIVYLGFYVNDIKYVSLGSLWIVLIVSFIIFNYPFGRIFLGDTGAYLCGFTSGYIIIDLFANYTQLPIGLAVVILFYPGFEVLFSYVRKSIQKKSPFYPDDRHLHIMMYQFFLAKTNLSQLFSNALVAPVLFLLWLSPLFFTISIIHNFSVLALLFIQILIYLIYYRLIFICHIK